MTPPKSLMNYPGVDHQNLRAILQKIQTRLCDKVLNSGTLAIGLGDKKKIKISNDVYFTIDGAVNTVSAAEITLTTANNVANKKANVISVMVDAAGAVTAVNGTEAATVAAVTLAAVPEGSSLIGLVSVLTAGAAVLTGGTTDLDAADVTVKYINCPGFNPSDLTW